MKNEKLLKECVIRDKSGDKYILYNNGSLYNIARDCMMCPFTSHNGYQYIDLVLDGNRIRKGIHQLVATAFIPNPENKPTVNHKDGCKSNNWDWNLEWATHSEQNYHAYKAGLRKPLRPDQVHFTKYNPDIIRVACIMMSKGIIPLEVEAKTGIPLKTLYELRDKTIWKEISCQYEYPLYKYPCMPGFDPVKREKIDELVLAGYKPAAIIKILQLPGDAATYRKVADIKYRVLKVQRLRAEQANGSANGSPQI